MYIAASAPGVCDFPNVNVALGSYLCNCSGERSFSVLSRLKNEIRTTMSDGRLNALHPSKEGNGKNRTKIR